MPTLDLGNVMGPQGPQGSIWYFGTDITGTDTEGTIFPDAEITLARLYDKYLNTSSGNIYTCVLEGDADTAKWSYIGNMKGPTGNIGPVGPSGTVDGSTPITFEEAETYSNIQSGESLGGIFGKIQKNLSGIFNGALSTVLGNLLTPNKVLVSDANGKVGNSPVTSTELNYLSGVTSNIQNQIGALTSLQTTQKGSLVWAVNELNEKMNTKYILLASGTADGDQPVENMAAYNELVFIGIYNQQIMSVIRIPLSIPTSSYFINFNDNRVMMLAKFQRKSNTNINVSQFSGFTSYEIYGVK